MCATASEAARSGKGQALRPRNVVVQWRHLRSSSRRGETARHDGLTSFSFSWSQLFVWFRATPPFPIIIMRNTFACRVWNEIARLSPMQHAATVIEVISNYIFIKYDIDGCERFQATRLLLVFHARSEQNFPFCVSVYVLSHAQCPHVRVINSEGKTVHRTSHRCRSCMTNWSELIYDLFMGHGSWDQDRM